MNSLYACGFLAMVNFHLLYIYPCWYRAWGNPISLWHRKKPEFQRKKIENTWEQAAESLSLFSSKVLCLYKKDRLSTLSSKDLSVVNRWFSLLVCSLKLHFPIVQCYIKQLKNMVYCSIVVCILKPQEGWEQPHSHWKKKKITVYVQITTFSSQPELDSLRHLPAFWLVGSVVGKC